MKDQLVHETSEPYTQIDDLYEEICRSLCQWILPIESWGTIDDEGCYYKGFDEEDRVQREHYRREKDDCPKRVS